VTTSQPAHEVSDVVVPGPGATPDRETLARVLDGLRDLDLTEQPTTDPASGPAGTTAAVPLPRRRGTSRG
jgi:hypothetical protein